MTWLLVVASIACALIGGIFYGFSSFIMPALGRIPANEAIHAMQRINLDVFHWSFMGVFFGTPLLTMAAAIQAFRIGTPSAALFAIGGCVVYIAGNFVVTAAGNVPLNEALASVSAGTAEATEQWSRYLVTWTRWNHVRTVASLCAAVAFLAALRTA